MQSKWIPSLLLVAVLALSGCRSKLTTEVVPAASAQAVAAELDLPTTYRGDRRYLPLGLKVVSAADAPFHYEYDVSYRRDDPNPYAVMFNPLRWFGYPIGKSIVTAVGALSVRESGTLVKKYEATAVVTHERTMYAPDSQTSLRATALGAVRKSIEAQMAVDAIYHLRSVASSAKRDARADAGAPR